MRKPHSRLIDMVGKTVNGCLVLERAGNHPLRGQAAWKVRAACGHEVIAYGNQLRVRESCGCLPYRCESCRPTKRGRKPYAYQPAGLPMADGHALFCDCDECLNGTKCAV